MDVDKNQPVQTFQKVGHCKLVWQIQNVYQCRKLLNTSIDGPDFIGKCASPFPWSLKLGQSKEGDRKGISLFMKWAIQQEDTPVNFRICVRKPTVAKPLLDEKYQWMFGYESVWESPLLVTNDDFEKEMQNEKFCSFIEILIESMWNIKVESEKIGNEDPFNASSKLLNFKEIGTDLKNYFRNSRFSDTYIKCENEEIPVHKAILEVRCPYFAQMLNSYRGGNWKGMGSGLVPTKDANVMKALLMYLYTGDVESLMENGPLPVGINKCAQRMKNFDLEWLTSPLYLCGASCVKHERLNHVIKLNDFHRLLIKCLVGQEPESGKQLKESFSNGNVAFSLQIKPFKAVDSKPNISVFLCLEELTLGESAYVIFDVSIKDGKKDIISKRIAGDLTVKSCIGFPGLVSADELLKNWGTCIICKVSRFLNDVQTYVEKKSENCKFQLDEKARLLSPPSALSEACHGWLHLSYDLGQLLTLGNHSDCVIVVGNDRLFAHRVILAARCPYFSKVLNAKEDECVGSSKGMEILVEKDIKIDAEMMKIILEEIYTGSCSIKKTQLAENISDLAKFLGLKSLEIKCSEVIENNKARSDLLPTDGDASDEYC